MIDTQKLRELLESAVPGPWTVLRESGDHDWSVRSADAKMADYLEEPTAKLIALAPEMAQALIDAEAQEAERSKDRTAALVAAKARILELQFLARKLALDDAGAALHIADNWRGSPDLDATREAEIARVIAKLIQVFAATSTTEEAWTWDMVEKGQLSLWLRANADKVGACPRLHAALDRIQSKRVVATLNI